MNTRIRDNQHGFGLHGVVVLLLVIGVVGAIGYVVLQRSQTGTTPPSVTVQPDLPVDIKTKADLQQTKKAVANTGQQLNDSMDTSSLGASVKSLL